MTSSSSCVERTNQLAARSFRSVSFTHQGFPNGGTEFSKRYKLFTTQLSSEPARVQERSSHKSTSQHTIMGPPSAKAYMGWWGHIGSPAQKGITSYSVSPYAQKPLAGVMHNAIFNTFRRVKSQFLFVAIPAGLYWAWWVNAQEYNEYLYTKAGREELERVNV